MPATLSILVQSEREQVETLIYLRRKNQYEELSGYAFDMDERKFYKNWYFIKYMQLENEVAQDWLDQYKFLSQKEELTPDDNF